AGLAGAHPRSFRGRARMARRSARLLTVLCLAAAPAVAQLRMTEVPIAGPPGVDSLARLGFEVADVRRVDGRLYAVIVTEARSERRLAAVGYPVRPVAIAAKAATSPAGKYHGVRSVDK